MKLKWAWMLGFAGIAGSIFLVVKEHLGLEHSGSADWLIPTFRNFDYPGFVAAPWIAEHLPFISHGDIGPTMTEVRTCDGIYILISGVLWFAIGAIIIVAFHRLRESKTSSISAK